MYIIFSVFETKDKKRSENIKYSSIKLFFSIFFSSKNKNYYHLTIVLAHFATL